MLRGRSVVLALGVFFALALAAVLVLIYVIGGGKQRGLSVKNVSTKEVIVRFEDGQSARLPPDGESTLSAKREDYPETITVADTDGKTIFERRLEFSELSDMSFRLFIGDDGLVPVPTVPPDRGIELRPARGALA